MVSAIAAPTPMGAKYMTMLVNLNIVSDKLLHSVSSGRVVRIEDFKPKGKYTGADARPDLKAFVAETVARLEPLKIEDQGPTHKHPWMGEFNALQWC